MSRAEHELKNVTHIDAAPTGASRHLDIQSLDLAWNGALGGAHQDLEPLELDLRNVTYIDQECLLFLVGVIVDRHRRRCITRLRLPVSVATVDFLRAWEFPRAVDLATDGRLQFTDLLDAHDRKLYAEVEQQPSRFLRVTTLDSGGREALLPITFFALTPVALADAKSAATLVRDKWLDQHLVGVLNRHLDGYGARIASVFHEAVLNAAMHPSAAIAFTSSQLLARPRPTAVPIQAGDREMVLSVWDDGASFADTLEAAWRQHGTVASPAYGRVHEQFEFQIIDRPAGRTSVTLRSSTEAIEQFRDPLARVLSAFLFGVSATPTRVAEGGAAEFTDDAVLDARIPMGAESFSGLGLHVIRRTVIDQFHGSLFYATGALRLTLTQGPSPGNYKAQLLHRLPSDPQVAGNLLVARMRLPAPTD